MYFLKKQLLDLTNAYLAIEGLMKSRVLSVETREHLQATLELLDHESEILMQEHSEDFPERIKIAS